MEGGNIPPNNKGKHWFTNGKVNRLLTKCPDSFWPGKTQKKGEEHGHFGKPKNYKSPTRFSKGHIPWNKGKQMGPESEETRRRKSEAQKKKWACWKQEKTNGASRR